MAVLAGGPTWWDGRQSWTAGGWREGGWPPVAQGLFHTPAPQTPPTRERASGFKLGEHFILVQRITLSRYVVGGGWVVVGGGWVVVGTVLESHWSLVPYVE